MPVSWIERRGRRILHVDYRNLGTTESVATLPEQVAAMDANPEPVPMKPFASMEESLDGLAEPQAGGSLP